jgi:hypothetical protein
MTAHPLRFRMYQGRDVHAAWEDPDIGTVAACSRAIVLIEGSDERLSDDAPITCPYCLQAVPR